MGYEIDIQNDHGYPVAHERLIEAVTRVLAMESIPERSAAAIVLIDDSTMADYNRQFRGVDAPTDVLSFPADAPPVAVPDEPDYLGDLLVAYPYASAQALREGHSVDDSLALLVIHGTLHLLGYDHDTPEHRAAMWAAQDAALRSLGISTHIVPSLEQIADDEDGEE
jgi:probable rRNA maturation factor